MIAQTVHLEYLSKVARGEVRMDSRLAVELNLVKYKGQHPPKSANNPNSEVRRAANTPLTMTINNTGSTHKRRLSYEMLDRRSHKRILSTADGLR